MRTLLVILLLAGCASTVPGTGTAPTPLPKAPSGRIVFQVEPEIGGLGPQLLFRIARPVLTVYGDGRAFVANVPNRYQAPWAFRLGTVPPATLARLLGDADRSGLFDGADYGVPQITDVGTTVVRFHPGGRVEGKASVYALSVHEIDGQLSADQRAHRDALSALIRRVHDAVQEARDWSPDRVDVIEPKYHDGLSDRPVAWPGPRPETLLTRTAWQGRCGTVTGTAAARLFAAARDHASPVWTVDGAPRTLLVRALLPGEPSCPN